MPTNTRKTRSTIKRTSEGRTSRRAAEQSAKAREEREAPNTVKQIQEKGKNTLQTKAGDTTTKQLRALGSEAPEPTDVPVPTGPPDFSTSGPALIEVDVKDIGTKRLPGENEPVLHPGESWVVLGKHEQVPDWAVGKVAAVITTPVIMKVNEETGGQYQYMPPKAIIEVRERSQGAQFFLPMEAFQEVSYNGGRGEVLNIP